MSVCEHHEELSREIRELTTDLRYIRRKVSEMDRFLRGAPNGNAEQPGLAVRLIQYETRIQNLEANAFPWRRICLVVLITAILSSGIIGGSLYMLQQFNPTSTQVDQGG